MENHHFLWENSLFLWPCSIAMLNYQRVLLCLTHSWKWIPKCVYRNDHDLDYKKCTKRPISVAKSLSPRRLDNPSGVFAANHEGETWRSLIGENPHNNWSAMRLRFTRFLGAIETHISYIYILGGSFHLLVVSSLVHPSCGWINSTYPTYN